MSVYVDDMRAPFGRMIMCHMLADTDDELHAMAEKIGVSRRWHQKPGTAHSHYDIALSKRALAVKNGAVEVDRRGVANLIKRRRAMAQPSIQMDPPCGNKPCPTGVVCKSPFCRSTGVES